MAAADSLFSPSWYLVAELTPRLRRHTALHRHTYRNEIWYVLQDHVSGQFHRFTPQAYLIIGKMDGERSLQQIWDEACERLGDDMPTQDDVIGLVSKLFRANVLHSDALPDMEALERRHRLLARQKLMQRIKSPLSIRLPLLDPEKFLNRFQSYINPLFSVWAAIAWLLVVTTGVVLAAVHWQALTSNLSDRVLAVENVLLLMLIYPVVKAVHELGHAFSVKRWGGEVHEIGIMFLVFFPVPYVDASAAIGFRNKYQRMLVGAIGILLEGFIAALAMVVWTLAEPGIVRSLAFNTMMISGVSTLFFNGNPLLRFDAYYVLSDWLEIPNLAARANQYVGYWVKRYGFGVRGLPSPAATKREAYWLAGYAVISYLYRVVIMLTIALFIASTYLFIGVLMALWTLWMGVVSPLVKLASKPFNDAQLQQNPRRTWGVIGSSIITIVLLLAVIPAPYATYTQGVLSPSENSQVRVLTSGYVDAILAEPGSVVDKGQPLARLLDPSLDAEVVLLQAQVREAEASYQASLNNRVDASINRELLQLRRTELQRALDKRQALTIVALQQGTFLMPNGTELKGRYMARGDFLGNVVDFTQLPVTAMLSEDDIQRVRDNTKAVEIRMVASQQQVYPAYIERIVPASSRDLVSTVLSVDGGGLVVTDPAAPKDQPQAFKRYFQLIIAAPQAPRERINERVYVLIEHDPEPLLWRWARDVRRVFLRQLDV